MLKTLRPGRTNRRASESGQASPPRLINRNPESESSIRPTNVGTAIRVSGAHGVDVSSGVESAPGKKEASLIHAFVAAARRTAARQPERAF